MLDVDNLLKYCQTQFISQRDMQSTTPFFAVEMPLSIELSAPSSAIDHIYWARPDDGIAMVALGRMFYRESAGSQRFVDLQQQYHQYCQFWATAPLAFSGFAFAGDDSMPEEWQDFPNAFVCVPQLIIRQSAGQMKLLAYMDVASDLAVQLQRIGELLRQYWVDSTNPGQAGDMSVQMDDSHANKQYWLDTADQAIQQVKQGEFKKLVLSRRFGCTVQPTLDTRSILPELAERYSSCTIISYATDGKQLIAATPERLLSFENGCIHSEAIGGTLSEAELIESRFLINKQSKQALKLLEEHGIIVEDICHRLDAVCDTLSLPTTPQLKKLHNIYHLETPICGKLTSRQSIFSLIELLHPTPAISGFPSGQAVNWLEKNENYFRGWYSGAFGWLEGEQSGEICVLLRCALIVDERVYFYAGAGLVADSDIEQEWQETELKINTIMGLL